ncbi:hypothetical protein VD0004_g1640 [Verticillium dahliae]|nr:hypothetical protein VD0004_g1640 [Verticillium dahliae]PNH76432.1 hypothetical protein VD0001_g1124 [Verticillium dahliae]
MEVSSSHTNGYSKTPNGKMNGHSIGVKRNAPRQGPSLVGRLFSIIARIATWWTIITVLFRCPSTLEDCDESSPLACRTYFQAKNVLAPHVEPYYETYAAPYVELAQPYYNIANERVLTPVKGYATKYGAPTLRQAQAYGQAQWSQNVSPQLAVYQKAATDKYDETVAPHVAKLSEAATPYYDIARTSALQTYHEFLLPAYILAQPYAVQGYDAAAQFTTDTIIPSANWAWNKTFVFLDTTVWPQVRVLYVKNVEPQLARIGQRLGRYKDKSKAAVESVQEGISSEASSFVKPASSAVSSATSSVSSSIASASKIESATHIPVAVNVAKHDASEQVVAPPADVNESDLRKTTRETVAEDLESWQTKFAKAADEGASEIEDRIEEISQRMVKENVDDIGASLLKGLQATSKAEVEALQNDIMVIVKNAGDDRAAGEQDLNAAVRRAGLAVKEKAQEIRAWKESFELDMEAAITDAAESHFKILDSIRDLALQRIGMKWAWMDGVTYKDWAKFHELKYRFDEWTNDLKKLIITHPALEDAREASGKIEDSGMAAAQSAAQELVRLKQVGLWKIIAGDSSDNFDSDAMRSASEAAEEAKAKGAAFAAAQAAAASRAAEESRAAEAEAEASRAAEESKAAQAITDASSAPEADPLEEAAHIIEDESPATDLPIDGSSAPQEDPLEAAANVLEDESPADNLLEEQSILSQVSSATDAASSVVESVVSQASDAASSVISDGSTIIAGSASAHDDLASTVIEGDDQTFVVNNTGSSPAEDDAQKPVTPEEKAEEHLEEQLEEEIIPESVEDQPVSAETETVKPAFLGVAAQSVANRKGPILDDDESTVESLSGKAQEAYSHAVAQASEKYSLAMSAVSAQLYGTPEPEPVQEKMFASVSGAYAGAMDAANSRLSEALEAASRRVYGTPTAAASPSYDWASVESLASQRLQEGRAWAEEQYESAKIALGLATATPTASTEKLLDQAKYNYYAGLGAAHARYSEFLSAASAAMSSLTATATPTNLAGTASSVASVATASANAVASGAQEDGLSVASYVSEGFEAAVSIVGDTVNAAAQEVLDAAEAVERGVVDTWENVVHHLSVQVYGAPTPTAWYGNAYSDVEKYAAQASEQAAKQYEVVQNIVQELIKGKEPSYSESILARLQAAYATGAASAASYLNEATAAAGDSVNAAKEKVNAAADAVKDGVRRDEL